MSQVSDRIRSFCHRLGLKVPILLAPMAGVSAPSLSIAVMKVGGLGAAGVLLMSPEEIAAWAQQVRAGSKGPYQLNLWIPDAAPCRDEGHESQVRAFLSTWGATCSAGRRCCAASGF